MFRSRTYSAILTLSAITILWISGTLGQDPAAGPGPASSSAYVPSSGEVSGVGEFPGGESVLSSGTVASDNAVAEDPQPAPEPRPQPYAGSATGSTRAPASGASSSSSSPTSSGFSAGSAASDGETGSFYSYVYFPGTTEPDPLTEADQRFVQSTRDLIGKYQEATDPGERETIRDQLNDVLVNHFEVRQQFRARELQELEAQVERLRELHNRREREKNQIVRDRLQQLLRDAEGLGWGASDAIPGSGARFQWPGSNSSQPATTPARPAAPLRH
jgi:hypothetical protein